ncbi:MAG: beta-galactosidase, partial [Muribaculaceae bacterium]|nr:beta-galactosidase [Muribaculaceae bacterium]
MKRIVALSLALLAIVVATASSRLEKHGHYASLSVDGSPYVILGGELGNSSATCDADIERIFPKLARMNLNTVLVPAYWELTEPVEGEFDFSLTDKVIDEARRNGLRVVFLWFGAWKNSMSCYAPAWFKTDTERFPRARTATAKPLEIASAFSPDVLEADRRAFAAWLRHIADTDKDGTVIMVQIENEIGMLEDARDHSKLAEAEYAKGVPAELMDYLVANASRLHPSLAAS